MFWDFFNYKGRMSRKKYFFTFFTVFILSILLLMGAGAGIFIVKFLLPKKFYQL